MVEDNNIDGNWSIPPEGMTRHEWLLSEMTNQKAWNVVNELFREGAKKGDGGTSDALKDEFDEAKKEFEEKRKAKEQAGGGSKGDNDTEFNTEIDPEQLEHYKKAKERTKNIKNVLKKESLTPVERNILEELLKELEEAIEYVEKVNYNRRRNILKA